MLPMPRHSHPTRKDRLGIIIFPHEPSPAEVHSPRLPWLFGDGDGSCFASRLLNDSNQDQPETSYDVEEKKAETTMMAEIADWLQTRHTDDFWVPRCKQTQNVLPTASQLMVQLRTSRDPTIASHSATEAFELFLEAIAVQLLASCYTLLPASSAGHLPLLQQRREAKPVTALRLHSYQRFQPAAGHHARAPSEAAPWPGLSVGPELEDVLANKVSRNRRLKRSSECTPQFAASGWTDGPSPSGANHLRDESHSTVESSTSSEPGFLSKLICQAAAPKHQRHKRNTLFTSHLSTRRRKHKNPVNIHDNQSEPTRKHTMTLQSLKSEAVQRIPSALRLRHTQSTPRFTVEEVAPIDEANTSRRHSSNPSIGSPLTYQYELPEIRRISATPAASQIKPSISHSSRAHGRSDVMVTQELVAEDQLMACGSPRRKSSSHLIVPPPADEDISPAAISPYDCHEYVANSQRSATVDFISTQTSTLSAKHPHTDYFNSVHAATHVDDDQDQEISAEDDLTTERDGDGLAVGKCPALCPAPQQVFATMDASDDDYSSDSDMERCRKRQSIMVHPEDTGQHLTQRFRPQHDDNLEE